jgi:hypothetical protein
MADRRARVRGGSDTVPDGKRAARPARRWLLLTLGIVGAGWPATAYTYAHADAGLTPATRNDSKFL